VHIQFLPLRNIAHSKVLLKFILRPDKYEEDLPVILTINQPSDIHNRKAASIQAMDKPETSRLLDGLEKRHRESKTVVADAIYFADYRREGKDNV